MDVITINYKNGTFEGMVSDIIHNHSRIVIFGTGVVGTTVAIDILKQYNLMQRVECFIDNDKTKWGDEYDVNERKIRICPPIILEGLQGNITIIVAITRYAAVLQQLSKMNCTNHMSCYILPIMCINNYQYSDGRTNLVFSSNRSIPKVIHYMWLGKKKMPYELERCLETWRQFCPDYEIVRWDETNYDVHKNMFVSQAYDNGKYGFVPDFARLDILYTYGGIYLDTDVELIKNIDDLLYQEAFCGVEKWQVLNFGSCSGAVKGHKSLERFIEEWSKRRLIRKDGTLDTISSGYIDTKIAIESGYKINGSCQNILGMNIYTYDYFNPYDYMSGKIAKTSNTYSIHHFNGGWLDDNSKENCRRTERAYEQLEKTMQWIG